MSRGVIKGDYIYYETDTHVVRAKINPLPEEDLNVKASLHLGRFIFGEIDLLEKPKS